MSEDLVLSLERAASRNDQRRCIGRQRRRHTSARRNPGTHRRVRRWQVDHRLGGHGLCAGRDAASWAARSRSTGPNCARALSRNAVISAVRASPISHRAPPLHSIRRLKLMDQVCEAPVMHGVMSRAEAETYAVTLFRKLQLPNPETFGDRYPHEVSGGQLQRAMAAMAMSCRPDIIVLDEPTHGARRDDSDRSARVVARSHSRIWHGGPLHHSRSRGGGADSPSHHGAHGTARWLNSATPSRCSKRRVRFTLPRSSMSAAPRPICR